LQVRTEENRENRVVTAEAKPVEFSSEGGHSAFLQNVAIHLPGCALGDESTNYPKKRESSKYVRAQFVKTFTEPKSSLSFPSPPPVRIVIQISPVHTLAPDFSKVQTDNILTSMSRSSNWPLSFSSLALTPCVLYTPLICVVSLLLLLKTAINKLNWQGNSSSS
jgi:hypothetical protein